MSESDGQTLSVDGALVSAGIDYSGPGSTVNRDPETGIRYGIISLHKLGEFAPESFEAEYDARCPHCGTEVPDDTHFTAENRPTNAMHGYYAVCLSCEKPFEEDDQYSDEASRNICDDGEVKASLDPDGDVWVFMSPYFTRAAFCSPCAPGACSLNSPCDDGERAYCLGPDWFDDLNRPPYPIYSAATGELIEVVINLSPAPDRDAVASAAERNGGPTLNETE
jgi:DNA-directed RNA polymerase subunit RPC12/RpoP